MAGRDEERPILLSVFDRLLDGDQDVRRSHRASSDTLREAVRRDLENLLNTRRRCLGWPADLNELDNSLVNYGAPDMGAVNLTTQEARKAFVDRLEEAIRRFEPRFRDVRIQPLSNEGVRDRTLRLRIEATIQTETMPETMVFDTVLQAASRGFAVESR